MNALLRWLDDRTGYRHLFDETLNEPVPGGARWRYVWGSALVFTFVVQVITGLFLWTAYSPSAQTAWESVYYIQHEMFWGGIVRGMHHFAAQAMVVLLALHLIQVVIDGAYRAPREVNFWLGMILAQIDLALSLTGYLLPWDQKGYYATQVSTKIIGATPFVGPEIQELVQGGSQYGHHTLTRFFAMHAGLLPALLCCFLVLHLYVFRRHGVHAVDPNRRPTATFWPDQVLRDAVACLVVLAVILLLAIFKGAELSAPANPAEAYSAARPEWYFLFLFRFLRFEAIEHFGLAFGAIYVPGAIMTVIVLMPLIAMIKGGHRFNVAFLWCVALAAVGLTVMSLVEDARDVDHQAAIAEAHRDAHRVVELAKGPAKIPVDGAGALLQQDPFTQGPRLFAKHCSSCHRLDGHDGRGKLVTIKDSATGKAIPAPATAPDLGRFGDRQWWRQILTNFDQHFAPTALSGYDLDRSASEGMLMWLEDSGEVMRDPENEQDVAALIEYFVAQSGRTNLNVDQTLVDRGAEIVDSSEMTNGSFSACTDCHLEVGGEFMPGAENGGYCELNGYGSVAWLVEFIKDPGHEQFYGDRNQMPAFQDSMNPKEIDLLARYLAHDYAPSEIAPYEVVTTTVAMPETTTSADKEATADNESAVESQGVGNQLEGGAQSPGEESTE